MADSFFRYIEEDVEYVRVEGEVWTDPEYRFNYKLGIKRFTFECTVERFSGGYCNPFVNTACRWEQLLCLAIAFHRHEWQESCVVAEHFLNTIHQLQ